MEPAEQFIIKFQDVSLAEANILAESLREAILDSTSSVSVERKREDPSSQDFGATLIVVIAAPKIVALAPALIAVAKGIEYWLKQHQNAKLRIERPNETIIIEKVTGDQLIDLAKVLKGD